MFWDKNEETWNVATHGAASIGSVILGTILHQKLQSSDITSFQMTVSWIFSIHIILVFLSSCLYHLEEDKKRKKKLRHLDQSLTMLLVPSIQVFWVALLFYSELENFILPLVVSGFMSLAAVFGLLSMSYENKGTHFFATVTGILTALPSLFLIYKAFMLEQYILASAILLGDMIHLLGCYYFINDTKVEKRYYHTYWHVCSMLGLFVHYGTVIYFI